MAKHETKRSDSQLVGEVRIAHPFHQEKRTKSAGGAPLDKPRNDAVLLYPKLGPAESCPNYARLSAMAMEAATKAWAGWPEGGKWPIQDGDIPHPHKPKPGEKALSAEQLAERNKWRTGSWVVEVSSGLDQGPKVTILRDGVMQDIPAQDVAGVRLYKSGDYGYVSMNAYTFHSDKPGGTWGVNFGYEGVAYTRQGDLIGSGPKSSAQMFAGIPGVSVGVAPPAAPRPPGAPAAPPSPPAAPLPQTASPPLAPAAPTAPALPPMPAAPAMAATGLPPIPGR